MEYPNPKIKYYRIRTFGERLNASFDYLRETWKPILKFTLYLILPICLIQSFVTNAVMRIAFITGYDSGAGFNFVSFIGNYLVYYLCILLGSAVISALVYTLMQEYERRETRLMNIRLADFQSLLTKNFKKIVGASLLFIAVMFLYAGLSALLAFVSLWTLIITIPLLLVVTVVLISPFALFIPMYLFEDRPLIPSLRKSFVYGFRAWGETFLTVLVFGLLANIISMATMMPWYILTLVGSVMGLANPASEINSQVWYNLLTYLLGIVQSYGIYLSSIITATGYAFQYFHVREKQESVSVDGSIRDFDKL
ncbi:MAG: hypothetical protein LBS42_03375 [Tannerella sp.]|jgi:hypothetical protein|nr:hypothetical protein [Tannerella sp.]